MSLHPRPALVFFDTQYRITQIDEVAQQILGPDSASRVGQPLAASLHDLEAGLDEVLQAGSNEEGRYLSGSVTLSGQSWRVEFILLPQQRGGVLIMRHDDGGVAKLLHDLRTPLNAMVGWLHLLGMDNGAAARSRPRALSGLRRAVDQQRHLLDGWNGTAQAERAGGGTLASTATAEATADGTGIDTDTDTDTDANADAGSGPDSDIIEFDPAMPGSTAPGTTISDSTAPGTAPQHSTAPGSAADGSSAPGTAGFDSSSSGPVKPGTRPPATTLPSHAPPGSAVDGQVKPGTVVHDAPAPSRTTPRVGTPGASRSAGTSAAPSPGRGHDDALGTADAHYDSPLAGVFVLAVDDNREMLRALESLLGRCGAVVETVTSAEAALQRYASWAAGGGERLLVSDLAMPQRDGLSLVKEIRKLERLHSLPRLPAIALSAHARPEARREAFASGFDLFLAKPVDPPVLLGHLRNMLNR